MVVIYIYIYNQLFRIVEFYKLIKINYNNNTIILLKKSYLVYLLLIQRASTTMVVCHKMLVNWVLNFLNGFL